MVSKMAIFRQNSKGGTLGKFSKNGRLFGQTSEGYKIRNTSRT